MSVARWAGALAMMIMVCAPVAAAAQSYVSNDSFDQMQSARIGTAKLIAGEAYEATFDIPSAWLPVELLGARVVMVSDPNNPGANYCGRFSVEVYEESNAATTPNSCSGLFTLEHRDPGAPIYNMTQQFMADPLGFVVRGDQSNYQDLLFSTINNDPSLNVTINPVILNTTRIRLVLRALDKECGVQSGAEFPLLLTDTDGEQGDNYIYGTEPTFCGPTRYHYLWRTIHPLYQLSSTNPPPLGDFVMRLILNRNPVTTPDMGSGDQDMGPLDMGPVDMGPVDMGPVDMGSITPDMGSTTPDMGGAQDMGSTTPDMAAPVDMGGGTTDMGSTTQDMGSTTQDMGSTTQDMGQQTGALAITSVSPDEVPVGTSTEVAILGAGFETGAEVTLDARKIGVVETRAQRILATVPADLAAKSYDVIVTNPSGASALLKDGLTVTSGSASQDMGSTQDMGTGADMSTPTPGGTTTAAADGCGCAQVPHDSHDERALFGLLGALGVVVLRRRQRVR